MTILSLDFCKRSIISQLEFLAFSGLTEQDKESFNEFILRVDVIGLTADTRGLQARIIQLRQQYNIKLPDAIIAATAIEEGACLVTADKQLQIIHGLSIIRF